MARAPPRSALSRAASGGQAGLPTEALRGRKIRRRRRRSLPRASEPAHQRLVHRRRFGRVGRRARWPGGLCARLEPIFAQLPSDLGSPPTPPGGGTRAPNSVGYHESREPRPCDRGSSEATRDLHPTTGCGSSSPVSSSSVSSSALAFLVACQRDRGRREGSRSSNGKGSRGREGGRRGWRRGTDAVRAPARALLRGGPTSDRPSGLSDRAVQPA